jgi:pentatricopeptide repeat protein
MQERGVLPDGAIFTSLLKACGDAAALESGRRIHSQIGELGLDDADSAALVAMYAKCGSMSDAKCAFDVVPSRDPSKWTALMMGYARHAESGIVADLWKRMIDEGIRPNAVTFLNAISLCSHTGLVDKARMWFGAMQTGYGILPSSKHLNSVIDLLCRSGHVEEAFVMAESMHCQADTVTWTILLAACQRRACPEHRKHIHGLEAKELYIDI